MYRCIYIEQITIRGPSYSAENNKECHYSSFFLTLSEPQRPNQDSIWFDLNGRTRIDKVHGHFVFIA